MFYDYLEYIYEVQITNSVVAKRHYVDKGYRLPREIRQEELEEALATFGIISKLGGTR
jgi:hypothetical protein